MKSLRKKIVSLTGSILVLSSATAFANTIQSLNASHTRVAPGTTVTFTMELSKASSSVITMCGVKVNFGDGGSTDIRLDEKDSPSLKFTTQRTYQNPGKYTITMSGNGMRRGLNSVFACEGSEKQVTVEVVDIEKIRLQQQLQKSQLESQMNKEAADRARQAELEAKEKAAQEKAQELERKVKELEAQAKKNAQPTAPKATVAPSPSQPKDTRPTSPSNEDGSATKKPKADSIL